MKKEIICTVCPRGCHIQVDGDGTNITAMEGFGCKRGQEYAGNEYAHPVRLLTTTVKMKGIENDLLPVRSNKPVPKEMLLQCMEVIRTAEVALPVARYDVVIADICGTGVDMVATKNIECM